MKEKQFLLFKTVKSYENAVANGKVDLRDVAFVIEDRSIRTHGLTFGGGTAHDCPQFISQDEYDKDHDDDQIYIILDPEDGDKPTVWVFGDVFPVILS
jgi:hypothetical protein